MNHTARCGSSILLVGLLFAPLSFGQDSPDLQAQTFTKYPWDMRPNKCFLNPEVPKVGMCQASPDWPDLVTTKRRVDSLLANQNFDLIERGGKEVGLSKAQFPSGDYVFEAWSLAFDAFFHYASSDFGAKVIKEWIAHSGREGFATLAEAYTVYGQAWNARGGGYSNTVSPEGWKLYHERLDAAYAVLGSASEEIRRSGPWQVLNVRLVFENPSLHSQRLTALKSAVSLWPDSLLVYGEPMRFSHPRWGGSFEEMEAIAQFAFENTHDKWGAAMYALVYERAFRGDPEATLADAAADWELMKQGFLDLESRTSDPPWIWRNFARLACQMRDRDEALRLYALYDSVRGDEQDESPDACREFVKDGRI